MNIELNQQNDFAVRPIHPVTASLWLMTAFRCWQDASQTLTKVGCSRAEWIFCRDLRRYASQHFDPAEAMGFLGLTVEGHDVHTVALRMQLRWAQRKPDMAPEVFRSEAEQAAVVLSKFLDMASVWRLSHPTPFHHANMSMTPKQRDWATRATRFALSTSGIWSASDFPKDHPALFESLMRAVLLTCADRAQHKFRSTPDTYANTAFPKRFTDQSEESRASETGAYLLFLEGVDVQRLSTWAEESPTTRLTLQDIQDVAMQARQHQSANETEFALNA